MADPITMIDTAGAVANIIDVVTKLINTPRKLHGWQDPNFTLLNLIAQIVALKAALRKIEEWLGSNTEQEQHHQLIMDGLITGSL